MRKEQLKKKLEDYYWNNKQLFEITTIEIMENELGRDNWFSIYTVKDGVIKDYIFDVCNYNSMWDIQRDCSGNRIYNIWDSVRASCSIYYNARDNVFTLPKFENITKEDIVKCTKYLMRNHLDYFCIFNIRFVEPDENTKFNYKPNRLKKFWRKVSGQV